jgi:hypothetical protein
VSSDEIHVQVHSAVVHVSDEVLADARETQEAFHRWLTATPEERLAMVRQAEAARAAQRREAAERKPLRLDALLDKMGWTREYAEHLVQPYCDCYDGMEGWEHCQHARDEGLA